MRTVVGACLLSLIILACGSSSSSSGTGAASGGDGGPPATTNTPPASTVKPSDGTGLKTFGQSYTGEYELGPVEWTGSYNNSCSPYTTAIESMEGSYLTGTNSMYNGDGSLCDACILVTTAKGKSLVLRVVTNGETTAPNNIDVSQEAYTLLNEGEYPRTMTWQVVECPDDGNPIQYQFQTEASQYWTSLWVRNIRVPIAKVEVQSANHASFTALTRGDDGTYTDSAGFGTGSFTLRVTSTDGQVVTDTFESFNPGGVMPSSAQFQ